MQTSRLGVAEIMASEAIVPFRYKDSVNVDTFGIGHTAPAGPPDPTQMAFAVEHPMAEVVEVFRRDLMKYERRVAKAVKVPLAQNEFDSLVSFDLNTGGINRAVITTRLNAGDRAGAAAAFDNWHRPPEIIPRRNREKALFRSGTYTSGGKANSYPADRSGRVLWGEGKRIDVMPAVDSIAAANAADARADKDRNAAAATGGGGTVVTAGGSQVDTGPAPSLPDLPTDAGSLRVFVVVAGLALMVIAAAFLVRSARRRREAKRLGSDAAAKLAAAVAVAAEPADPTPLK